MDQPEGFATFDVASMADLNGLRQRRLDHQEVARAVTALEGVLEVILNSKSVPVAPVGDEPHVRTMGEPGWSYHLELDDRGRVLVCVRAPRTALGVLMAREYTVSARTDMPRHPDEAVFVVVPLAAR